MLDDVWKGVKKPLILQYNITIVNCEPIMSLMKQRKCILRRMNLEIGPKGNLTFFLVVLEGRLVFVSLAARAGERPLDCACLTHLLD